MVWVWQIAICAGLASLAMGQAAEPVPAPAVESAAEPVNAPESTSQEAAPQEAATQESASQEDPSQAASQTEQSAWSPGRVVEVQAVDLLGNGAPAAWSGWLSNHIRAHALPMTNQPGRATLRVYLVGGMKAEPEGRWGVSDAAVALLNELRLTETQAAARLATSGWSGSAQTGRYGLVLSFEGPVEGMEDAVAAVAQALHEPVWSPGGFSRWRERTKAARQANGNDDGFTLNRAIDHAMDMVDQPGPVLDGPDALLAEHVQEWMAEQAVRAQMSAAVVGDIDRARTMEVLAHWFGGLGQERARISPTLPEPWGVRAQRMILPASGDGPAMVLRAVIGPTTGQIDQARRLRQLTLVLDDRARTALRAKGLDASGVRCGMIFGDQHAGRSMLWLLAATAPEQAEQVLSVFDEALSVAATTPITEAEMAALREQTSTLLDRQLSSPGYWADRLTSSDANTLPLLDAGSLRSAYESISADELTSVLREHLVDERRIELVIKPFSPVQADEAVAPKEPSDASNTGEPAEQPQSEQPPSEQPPAEAPAPPEGAPAADPVG